MKNILKRSLSVFLAITIIFSSAYVGLNELDFGGLFAVKAEAASVDDLTFTLNDDGASYSVTDCNTTAEGELIIPDTYEGLPVTSIGYGAFEYCTSLTSTTIPDSVTSISSYAFYNCTNLTSVTIPDSVMSIGSFVFYNCDSLTSITIPDSVTSIGYKAFIDCTCLKAINVDENNLYYCSIDGVLFNKSKTALIKYPEGNINSGYTIPDSVKSIGNDAFKFCKNLKEINVNKNNSVYSSKDGVLYNKIQTELIMYPTAKLDDTFIIPDSVTSIGEYAFRYCTNLTSIIIGNGVTSIANRTFYNCRSLTSVTINNDVTSIGNFAFSNCTNLTSVTIGNGVTSIGNFAFSDCTNLISIKIPDSVKSIGEGAFCRCKGLSSIKIPDSVNSIGCAAFENCEKLTSIIIPDSVTSIGDWAFNGCESFTSITIPEGVTNIGEYTFDGCIKLTSITIPEGVTNIGEYAFDGCINLTSITIPDSVTSIGDGAFYNCNKLNSITIPDGVTSIGGGAFSDCTSLTSITIPDSVTSIGGSVFYNTGYYNDGNNWDNDVLYIGNHLIASETTLSGEYAIKEGTKTIAGSAFSNCGSLTSITIPDSVISIGDSAFYWCYRLISITIPDGVTSIGDSAFENCENLTSITIPDSVTSIGNEAFENCNSLTSITIPDSITSIGFEAFGGCESLTSITIPDSVTSIGDHAFSDCTNLTSVTVGNGVTSIGNFSFCFCDNLKEINTDENNINYSTVDGVLFNKNKTKLIRYPKGKRDVTYTIPDSVTSIGGGAFSDCTSLTSITIPDSVTSIGDSAFYDCRRLASITIPDSVTSIGDSAFSDCTSLISITIPDSVTSIGDEAFYWCYSLTSITIPDSVTSIGGSVFYNTGYYNDGNNWDNDVLYIGNHLIASETTLSGEYAIKEGTKTIAGSAFSNHGSLTSIMIPDSVISIGDSAFDHCQRLDSVYITDIGAWCNIDFDRVSSNPLSCADNLYINGELATDVVIPENAKKISDFAFCGYNIITSVTIPDSITSIGYSAFFDCKSLKYVFYSGQQSQWENLLAGSYNNGLSDLTVHFGTSEHIPSKEWVNDADFDCINNDVNFKHNYCEVCGCLLESKEVFTDGHLFVDDICEYCGVFVYSYSVVNNEVTITNYLGTAEEVVIPSVLEGYPVTSIGKSAFNNNKNIESVVIPEGVTNIGDYVFEECYNLESVVIPDSVTNIGDSAFSSCQKLTNISIPEGVTNIGLNAFCDCSSLITITIPDSVISMGEAVFDSCLNLEKVTIGNGVNELPLDTFSYCKNLTSVVMGINISKIKNNAFKECDKLSYLFYTGTEDEWESVVIGTGNTNLKNSAIHYNSTDHVASDEWENSMDFDCESGEPGTLYKVCKYCECVVETKEVPSGHVYENAICVVCGHCDFQYKIVNGNAIITNYIGSNKDVTIPASIGFYPITQIGAGAFLGCPDITSIVVPETITYMGIAAFLGCKKLEAINVDDENEQYASENGLLFDKNKTVLIKVPCAVSGRVVVPDGVETIGNNAFSMCDKLVSVVIPDSVKNIGESAFDGCSGLTDVYYNDLKTQWENITIGTYNINLTNANIHYKIDGHFYGDWIIDTKATCTESGSRQKTCSLCGDVVTETINSFGHTKVIDVAVAATCTKTGKTEGSHCSVCGEVIKAQTTIVANGHKSSSWITDKKATVTAAGKKHKECTDCGEVLETATIEQLKCSKPTLKSIANTEYGVLVKWGTVKGADKYYVYRKTSGGSYSRIGSTSKTYYTDKTAKSGTKYYYAIKARNEVGNSSLSSSLSKYYLADPTLKTPESTKKGITLNWSKVKGADGYVIYYKTGSGSYKKLTTVKGSSKVTYIHTKAKKGKTYIYKVKAYKSKTYSAYSNAKKIKDKY